MLVTLPYYKTWREWQWRVAVRYVVGWGMPPPIGECCPLRDHQRPTIRMCPNKTFHALFTAIPLLERITSVWSSIAKLSWINPASLVILAPSSPILTYTVRLVMIISDVSWNKNTNKILKLKTILCSNYIHWMFIMYFKPPLLRLY